MGWVVKATPRPPSLPRNDPVPIVQGAVLAPRPVWAFEENLAFTGIRSPDRATRNESVKLLYMILKVLTSIVVYEGESYILSCYS
jgi:hypothetical protein